MNLLERLKSCVQDERDIEPIILLAASGSTTSGPNGSVDYNSAGQLFARVTFKNKRITKIESGSLLNTPNAQDQFIAQAKEQAAHKHGTFVSLRVLFSERKLNGYYSWGDKFRIAPCPDTAPIGHGLNWADMHGLENMQHEGPPFPLVLEVRSERSPNCLIESNRTFRDLDTYQHILTLLLNGRLRYAHWSSDRVWVSIKREQKIECHLLYSGFDIGESGRVDDFPQRENAPATRYSGSDYYNHLWGQDKELLIPDTLDDDLEIIHTLSDKEMTKLRRAVYWYSLGIQHIQEQSLATLAFSTAIECLLPSSLSAQCPTCKKPTQGPTQLFKKHIKRYGTIPESLEKDRNKLYDIRSALVHGSHATKIDTDFFFK